MGPQLVQILVLRVVFPYIWKCNHAALTEFGPDYMSRAGSVCRDDFQPGITWARLPGLARFAEMTFISRRRPGKATLWRERLWREVVYFQNGLFSKLREGTEKVIHHSNIPLEFCRARRHVWERASVHMSFIKYPLSSLVLLLARWTRLHGKFSARLAGIPVSR